jgi:hypothetical protein
MAYYAGDFYMGDPGIGSFFGGLVKRAVGFIPGIGPIASAAVGAVGGGMIKRAGAATSGVVKAAGGVIMRHPVVSGAAAAGIGGAALGAAGSRLLGGGGGLPPKGYHRCKSKHGCKHGEFVKNRHMNPCNPRALRRAIRRAHSFTRLAMKTIHLVHPKKKGRFGGFKKRRAKK